MKLNSAELEMASVGIEELKASADGSYKPLFRMSRMIGSSCSNLMQELYDFNAVGRNFPRYLLAPEWNECCRQFRSRFLAVAVKDDFVAVPLKLNQIPRQPWHYSISFPPVSAAGNLESVVLALQALSGHCVRYVAVGEDGMKNSVDNNYYNTAEDFRSWMDKSRWRSKNGIGKLSGLIEFRNEWYGGIEDDIAKCGGEWNRQRENRGLKPHPIRCDIEYARRRMSPFCYSFFCRGRMVGYMLPAVFKRCASILATKAVSLDESFCRSGLGLGHQEAHLVLKHLGRYMQYEMHRDLLAERHLDAVYYYGDVGDPLLREFKETVYRNRIWYNRYSIEEYIESVRKKMQNENS